MSVFGRLFRNPQAVVGFAMIVLLLLAAVLGMTKSQIFFKVVFLQVVKRIIPPMSNEIITLIKDTSLANVIAVTELMFMAQKQLLNGLIWPLFYAGAFYLLFSGLITIALSRLEKKLGYFKV